MKLRFNSFDIICGVTELQCLIGLRVNQIYDIDNKTYLIRFQDGKGAKKMLLIESGIRFHTTSFEWPKNTAPSGFSMKLRKHLKNKRLEKLHQLGVDRIVDFQFGVGEACYHIFAEFYDRGNIILTDYEMTILHILRPCHDGDNILFAVRQKYAVERAKKKNYLPNDNELLNIISKAQNGDNLRRVIMPLVDCGPTVIDHVLCKNKLGGCIILREPELNKIDNNNGNNYTSVQNKFNKELKTNRCAEDEHLDDRAFSVENHLKSLMQALQEITKITEEAKKTVSKGYILQKREEKPTTEDNIDVEHFYQNIEYNPFNFCQYEGESIVEFETFMLAVDEYYSTLESQKLDMKTLQKKREALKKLSNVKKDHAKRIEVLNKLQRNDKQKAELITMNQGLVDNAILAIRSAIANQMSWPDIHELVKAAQANGDTVACAIKQLKLEINHISLKLSDLYSAGETVKNIQDDKNSMHNITVDVDLALSAWANARKYYDQKRSAAQKEQKTIDASQKALKSAERKTQQTLKDVRTISIISKARKVYWFEKFYWFISSENYLVIGGRDAQQNELIVKRYMRLTDIYVHADIQGASSVVIRNPTGLVVPPKTLLEAGTMAISYSIAWDAKVVTNAYWVRSDQVSKTAPTGEYLGTGSFMIRGKKNFLPSCPLIMGISLMFKLEDSFIENHQRERISRNFEQPEEQVGPKIKMIPLENENLYRIFQDEAKLVEENKEDKNNEKSDQVHVMGNTFVKNKSCDKRTYAPSLQSGFEFPDTQVNIEYDSIGITFKNKFKVIEDVCKLSQHKEIAGKILNEKGVQESIIIQAAPSRKKQQQVHKKHAGEKDRNSQNVQQQSIKKSQIKSSLQEVKRGQKGKLKKIKAKYKNQDEEERQLRMQILKSAGKSNIIPDPKLKKTTSAVKNSKPKQPIDQNKIQVEGVEDIDEFHTGADVEMIASLTGQPFDNDELLFVIPVVAPYQTLQNYKFKIKLTPGNGRRGRAAKTALTVFSNDKMCTRREKDLLKSIREEALARNIPGRVKLSAPQLQRFQK